MSRLRVIPISRTAEAGSSGNKTAISCLFMEITGMQFTQNRRFIFAHSKSHPEIIDLVCGLIKKFRLNLAAMGLK